MRTKLLIFSILFFILSCGSEEAFQVPGYENALENVLTLDLSFGSDEENIKDEFLLAKPVRIGVSPSGDIVVSDEYSLKVFDENGKEKMIVGRMGQGPGEFGREPTIWISNTGYLIADESSLGGHLYSIFSPDEKNVIIPSVLYKIISLNEHEKIFQFRGQMQSMRNEDDKELLLDYLMYNNGDSLLVLAEYITRAFVSGAYTKKAIPLTGTIFWSELPDRRVVFSHAAHDFVAEDGNYMYTLNITSLYDFESEKIKLRYSLVVIPESIKESLYHPEYFDSPRRKAQLRDISRKLRKIGKNTKYYPFIFDIKTDGNYIFVFTYKTNNLGHRLVEVIDASTKQRISTAYFPIYPWDIRNGYAYTIAKDEEGFPIVEKYKIDPAVYGK